MDACEILALIRRIHFAPRSIDQTFISEIFLQIFVVRVQEARAADLGQCDYMCVVGVASPLLVEFLLPFVHCASCLQVYFPG